MLVHKGRKALIFKPEDMEQILAVVPTAKPFRYKGTDLLAVPHRIEEVRVLRNMGVIAPGPIEYYYGWPRSLSIDFPFEAQKKTADFATLNAQGFILNGMGSGKTLACLWAYDYLRSQGLLARALVVAPLSTLERTWGDAIFDHFPHLTFTVVYGTRDKRFKLLDAPADIYIVNHDGVKIIGDALAERPDIDLIMVDEIAQAARNARTDRWKALNKVINKQKIPRMRWGITGMPTPNEPTDAWAQARLINPSNVPPYFNRFKDMTMRQVGPYRWVERDNAMDIVFEALSPAIRYSREECVDLPPTTYLTREVLLTPEQVRAYKQMQEKLAYEVETGQVLAVNEAVKAMRLVEIACGVSHDTNGVEVSLPNEPRLALVHELVEESEGKVLVFVPFISSVKMVAEYLRTKGLSVEIVYSAVSKSKRDEIFSSFQRSKHPQVIVAQPGTMSHGLTLTAASTTVWYAPITSHDTYGQANERTPRPGQKLNTLIVNIEGTPIERKMYKRLKNKEAMQNILLEKVEEARA